MSAVSFMKRPASWLIVSLAVVLAGCQTMGGLGSSGVDPRLSNSQSAEFFSKSGMQACAGGAAIGALACLVGNANDKGTCLAAAALVGCGVGMGANYYLDNRRAQYANDEQRLDVAIADVQKDNRELQDLTRTAQSVIDDDRRSLLKIKSDIAAKKVQKTQAQQRLVQIDKNASFLKDKLANAQAKQREWQKVAAAERNTASAARLDTLNAEINNMQKQISSLETEIDQLYKQRSSIRLG
ncbi:hypothetical protein [Azomonas macrocytogenes]|uniref:Uncharacterized protein n=1 Tax=Azomonas macrocytogenes TaxID=69962 RepID=A0A839T528_AZOMA|nr:hypothetical protein [Azomonas macrocytogenes]MBB3103015.1 hypothetical protein [Azomonas macrocytogenes]